ERGERRSTSSTVRFAELRDHANRKAHDSTRTSPPPTPPPPPPPPQPPPRSTGKREKRRPLAGDAMTHTRPSIMSAPRRFWMRRRRKNGPPNRLVSTPTGSGVCPTPFSAT